MTAMDEQTVRAAILVADDERNARLILRRMLEQDGYEVAEASDGAEALEIAEKSRPDLILLDALMPTIDGFEVCTRLHAASGTDRIPVIMITALDDAESVDRAFEAGASDYVTKPVHQPVLRQRVRRILLTRQLEQFRDDLMHMIVHDMKSPLNLIKGFAELALEDIDAENYLHGWVDAISRSCDRLLDMTMMILDSSRLEEGKLTLERTVRPVSDALNRVQDTFNLLADERHIAIAIDCPNPELEAELDWGLMERVIGNLLHNAIKHSPDNTTVTLGANYANDGEPCLLLSVTDQGEGISPEDQARIFDKYAQASRRRRGTRLDTGLGLTFCKLATEAHGGYITVQSAEGAGATFTVVVPISAN